MQLKICKPENQINNNVEEDDDDNVINSNNLLHALTLIYKLSLKVNILYDGETKDHKN